MSIIRSVKKETTNFFIDESAHVVIKCDSTKRNLDVGKAYLSPSFCITAGI